MSNTSVRYEPHERPPQALAFGLALQQGAVCLAGIVITPIIVIRAADGGEPYLSWAVFAALLVSGLTTALQAVRVWGVGAGYPLLMGTSAAFIAVCVAAIAEGGPAMLATLVLIAAMFQFALAARLAWLRKLITPTVAGVVIMLIAVTVMPVVFDMLKEVPEGTAPIAAPVSTLSTLVVIVFLSLKASGSVRLWVPVIGLLVGSAVASAFGLYDFGRVAEADWFGVPDGGWPGLDLSFGPTFWALLPAFVFVTLIGAIETIGDASAVQGVAWRQPRAVDFRAVQGAVAADGAGNFLSGIAGTVPNTTYSSSIAITEITGVAARSVGVWIGVIFVAVAFIPKAAAVLLAIPGPVAAAYLTVLLAILFVLGMKMVIRDGVDYRTGVIVGVSFWVGVGFQQQVVFAEQLGEWWGSLLGNGMTSGGLTAILLTFALQAMSGRRRRIETTLNEAALTKVDALLGDFTKRRKWNEAAANRLRATAEETLLTLIDQPTGGEENDDGAQAETERRLRVSVRGSRDSAEMEFIAGPGHQNLEDMIVLLPDAPHDLERESSLRLLRHYAASVHHQQYHGSDIVIVHVDGDDGGTDSADSADSKSSG